MQTFSVTTAKMFEPRQPHDLEFHSLLAGPFVSRLITTRLVGRKERLHEALRFLEVAYFPRWGHYSFDICVYNNIFLYITQLANYESPSCLGNGGPIADAYVCSV